MWYILGHKVLIWCEMCRECFLIIQKDAKWWNCVLNWLKYSSFKAKCIVYVWSWILFEILISKLSSMSKIVTVITVKKPKKNNQKTHRKKSVITFLIIFRFKSYFDKHKIKYYYHTIFEIWLQKWSKTLRFL